jgi:hypothetical protein
MKKSDKLNSQTMKEKQAHIPSQTPQTARAENNQFLKNVVTFKLYSSYPHTLGSRFYQAL